MSIVDSLPIDRSPSPSEELRLESVQGNVTASGMRIVQDSMAIRIVATIDHPFPNSEFRCKAGVAKCREPGVQLTPDLIREISSDDKWIATHLLLSERHYQRSQRVESTHSGYSINANGLHVDVTPDGGGGWLTSYPSLARDRATITDFWMMHSDIAK